MEGFYFIVNKIAQEHNVEQGTTTTKICIITSLSCAQDPYITVPHASSLLLLNICGKSAKYYEMNRMIIVVALLYIIACIYFV